ncbi:unnamed protein product [Acanthoscelides obtectus]|uniref:Anticodon-binding domain-containing protein n=1 Tax=Acanthoscelides obtectus TaxID=200917 RepID=A0A9P0PUH6_ACAOB|nr:unnamed protein product [Acanthoscelides obtectus]CAK1669470.1 DNA polymerase subunit gamma-2, mitochondrial [Acanthoscelides obtectus]
MFFKIADLAVKHGFIRKNMLPNINFDQYKFGPVGLLLLSNLESEWFFHFVINKDVTVFINKDDFTSTFNFAKNTCCDRLPFGIVEKKGNKKMNSDDLIQYKTLTNSDSIEFCKRFPEEEKQFLKGTFFISPNESTKFFHQFQRQRRIWWRKISASPGRYLLTDNKTCENGSQTVEINAKYPWGYQEIEKLVLNSDLNDLGLENSQVQFKEGRKAVRPHTVTSTINLSTMFLNFLCDGYEEPLFQGKPRTILRFHRKVAPYRISFAVSGTNAVSISELSDLALYLSRQLRSNHISTLLLPSTSKHSLEAQYKQYDQLGVPYTAVLNENTLKDGILYLRSRDTTLKEQVHVTSLVTYIEQLFKNY